LSKVKLPPNTATIRGFKIITGETYFDTFTNKKSLLKIESVDTQSTILANDTPADLNPLQCSLTMDPPFSTIATPNVTFKFKVVVVNELPNSAHIEMTFGKDLKIPVGTLKVVCDS
jgi:hypothetical protein